MGSPFSEPQKIHRRVINMGNIPGTVKKGGYSGNQRLVIRFRASDALHQQLQKLARQQGVCLATLVRRLVLVGLHESGRCLP